MPTEQFYDGAFAELFHHPKFIRSLLLDFIDEEWVLMIDLDSMQYMLPVCLNTRELITIG